MEQVKEKPVFKIGFIKQDLKKNFFTNLSVAFNFKIIFQQSTDLDIFVLSTNQEFKIYGLVPIIHYILSKILKRLHLEHQLAHKDALWNLLEMVRSDVEFHLDGQDLDQDIFQKSEALLAAVKESKLLRVAYFSILSPVIDSFDSEKVCAQLEEIRKEKDYEIFEKKGRKKRQVETKVFTENLKLRRLNPSKVPLPTKHERNILITSALPYCNAVPHLGNLIGCVLSADVYSRFTRLRGYNSIYICGTDEYGTATETKALQDGVTPQDICKKYYKIHSDIYEWFDIDFAIFGRTSTEIHTKISQDIFLKLHEREFLTEQIVKQYYCDKCNRFLADRYLLGTCPLCNHTPARGDQCENCGKQYNSIELKDPICSLCRTTPRIKESEHIFINLPKIQPLLKPWLDEATKDGKWSANAEKFSYGLLKEGLKQRCITRDLKWGVQVPLEKFKQKVFYVWFDAPIGYFSITANLTPDWEKWWKNEDGDKIELVQFMGKDNTTFHSVMFPCTLLGTGQNWTLVDQLSITEYLNFEGGLKFSKSRGTGVFGDNARDTKIPPEVWRYYLLINRPETADTEFLWNDLQAKNNSELLNNLGNYCQRVLKFLEHNYNLQIPKPQKLEETDLSFLEKLYGRFLEYIDTLEKIKIKDGLKVAILASGLCNQYLQETEIWNLVKKNKKRVDTVLFVLSNALYLLGKIFEPYMPGFSAKLYHNMGIKTTEESERIFKFLVEAGDAKVILELVKPGHKIKEAIPIFREISNEEVEELRARFKGKEEDSK